MTGRSGIKAVNRFRLGRSMSEKKKQWFQAKGTLEKSTTPYTYRTLCSHLELLSSIFECNYSSAGYIVYQDIFITGNEWIRAAQPTGGVRRTCKCQSNSQVASSESPTKNREERRPRVLQKGYSNQVRLPTPPLSIQPARHTEKDDVWQVEGRRVTYVAGLNGWWWRWRDTLHNKVKG